MKRTIGVAPPLLAAFGGLLLAVPFLRFALWPLAWVAFVPILLAMNRAATYGYAVRIGLVAGLAGNVPAFHWLTGTIHLFGGFPLWLSIVFYGALSLYSAGQFALLAVAVRRLGFGPLALFPPMVWVALEFLYPTLFPWRVANTQFPVPELLQIGEYTGPFGLSFVMVWLSASLARCLGHDGTRALTSVVAASVVAGGLFVFGASRIPAVEALVAAAPEVRVGLIQGNLSVEEKGNIRYFDSNLQTYRRLSEKIEPTVDVVIWPESVISEPLPRNLDRLPPRSVRILGIDKPLLAGALTYEADRKSPRLYNSVVLFDGEGRVLGMSDKQILMPFGEYMPLGDVFPWLRSLSPMTGNFRAGERVVPLEVPGGGRFAPLNCYEDLKAEIPRRAVRTGGAEILFAVANDAWFGNTAAPYQHEALALWRAVENRRFLLRVTNTGVTDVIDPLGRVRLRLPVFTEAAAVAKPKRMHVETFFTRYGDVFAWVLSGFAAILLIVAPRKR